MLKPATLLRTLPGEDINNLGLKWDQVLPLGNIPPPHPQIAKTSTRWPLHLPATQQM